MYKNKYVYMLTTIYCIIYINYSEKVWNFNQTIKDLSNISIFLNTLMLIINQCMHFNVQK